MRRLDEEYLGAAVGGLDRARLTERETDVLRQLSQGRTNAEIAGILVVSTETGNTHVAGILVKLGDRDRAQGIIAAEESLFIRPDQPNACGHHNRS